MGESVLFKIMVFGIKFQKFLRLILNFLGTYDNNDKSVFVQKIWKEVCDMGTHQKLYHLVLSALFAAAIAAMTAYLLHIPIPTGGYIHLGDSLIYLAACLLPFPYAVAASAVGAGLADLLTAPMWVIPTLIIKALTVLPFTNRKEKIFCLRNCIAIFVSGLISSVSYGLAAYILLGDANAFLPQFLGTLVQAAGSGAIFVVIALTLDNAKVKAHLAAVV